jgi:DNA polymerase-3 subunit epsilon
MNFFAVDVETANSDFSSICQIGIVEFKDDQVTTRLNTLINPEDYFDPFNVSIHGITARDVKSAPKFNEIHSQLSKILTGNVTVHHMPFDWVAITRACNKYDLQIIEPIWLDSAKIVRRTWDEFAHSGFGLANITQHLGIEFSHHDALEDARAAGMVVQHACEKTGFSIEDWLQCVKQRVTIAAPIKFEGNPDGPLYGENIVFTGSLMMQRKEAAKIASDLGCNVNESVTKKTTMIVVGVQESYKLGGYEKSSKHRKAEVLITKGVPIKILTEKDFIEMCNVEKKTNLS